MALAVFPHPSQRRRKMNEERVRKPEREWTVMFYLASDNPLAPGTITHLKAIKNAGYHPDVNVLALFDPHTVNLPVHIFDVNRVEKLKDPDRPNIGFAGNNPFIRNLVIDKLWPGDVNKQIQEALDKLHLNIKFDPQPEPPKEMRKELSPRESLDKFLTFCQESYPARHYMLFIVGHGVIVGNELFLHDEHVARTRTGNSPPTSLSLKDLATILGDFNNRLDKGRQQLELIGFHACSMSGVEVALELDGMANFMIAAQGPTYNGAWPYRQVLIRLFNDLESGRRFTQEDLPDGFVDAVKSGTDRFSKRFRRQLNGNGGRELLKKHVPHKEPARKLVGAVTHQLNTWMGDPKLCKLFPRVKLPDTTKGLLPKIQSGQLNGKHLQRFNRELILGALPQELAHATRRINVKRLCRKIFHYCVFNSFDFQLAGYSCDLSLCDLNKVKNIKLPVSNLVKELQAGLTLVKEKNDFLVRDLILLAHWESQSFFEEQYTDLYDFCFRLKAKCEQARRPSAQTQSIPSPESPDPLKNIEDACLEVMKVLKRGTDVDDHGVIVRSEFVGPTTQYAHGLSVFFPWSEPVANPMWENLYKNFAFNKETQWKDFLKQYFTETMRKPSGDEDDALDESRFPDSLDTDLLELLQKISTKIFNDDGQLGHAGSIDPMGVAGSRDPQGDDCDCPSIKNFPSISHSDKHPLKDSNRQVINMFRQFGQELKHRRRS